MRDWTNGAAARAQRTTGACCGRATSSPHGEPEQYVAWDARAQRAGRRYDPGTDATTAARRAACSEHSRSRHADGHGRCADPVFDLSAELCRRYQPGAVEAICGVDAARRRARRADCSGSAAGGLLRVERRRAADERDADRPGDRALYALTGSFDAPGRQRAVRRRAGGRRRRRRSAVRRSSAPRRSGLPERPLGPRAGEFVTADEMYRAILEQQPYAVRGLVGFGANLLLAHADSSRGRDALAALDFYVHADLFMNPTAELADIVLPVATPFETRGAQDRLRGRARRRSRWCSCGAGRAAARRGALGHRDRVRPGDAAWGWASTSGTATSRRRYRYQLGPSGVSLEALRANPGGVRVPLQTRYRKFAEQTDGVPHGFATPTRQDRAVFRDDPGARLSAAARVSKSRW